METYKNINGQWEFSKKEKAFIDTIINNNYSIIEYKQLKSKSKAKIKIDDALIIEWEIMLDTYKFDDKQLSNYIDLRKQIIKME